MIDLHCHLLPGLDDGPADLDAALALAELAVADGIGTVVAKPHYDGVDRTFPARATEAWVALRQAIEARGLPLNVLLGYELLLTPALAEWGAAVRELGLNGGRYLLVELPLGFWPPYLHDVLFRLQGAGMRPILAHVERYTSVARNPELAAELVGRGMHLQINADSLLGMHGKQVQRCAQRLLARGSASFLATDAHSTYSRPPRLSAAAEISTRRIGFEGTNRLLEGNAASVIDNGDIPPMSYSRTRGWRQFLFR